MNKENEILKRINAVSDEEWRHVIDDLTTFVSFKLNGKTLYGAHTESNLGLGPVEYYVEESIFKLLNLDWEWKFEEYSLLEQLRRIAGSLISANVEKFRNKKLNITYHEEEKLSVIAGAKEADEDDFHYRIFKEALLACSEDDEELQLYVMALDECNTFDEMSKLLGFGKPKLYALQKKITRRIKVYLEKKIESGT